jgi:hypothetical protein
MKWILIAEAQPDFASFWAQSYKIILIIIDIMKENLPILFLNDFKMDFLKILSDQGRATSISLKPSVYRRFGGFVVRVMKNQNCE